jgi:hypothetical protein
MNSINQIIRLAVLALVAGSFFALAGVTKSGASVVFCICWGCVFALLACLAFIEPPRP